MNETTSPSGALDKGNVIKILKGLVINLGGAFLTYLVVTTFPQVLELAKTCIGDNSTCHGISPHTALILVFLVPFGATLVNTFKEYITNYETSLDMS